MIGPPGYELVKEEDKNILIGDTYIAPAVTEFGGLASIYIMPDQAAVGATYNANNAQNPTTDLAAVPRHEGDTGDRKSTRLNSSHRCISYAVFCLKKKTIRKLHDRILE